MRFPIVSLAAMRTRREFGVAAFVFAISLANAILFQWPLYALAVSTRAAFDSGSVLAIATLFVLQMVISVTVLGLSAIVSRRLLKCLCALFTVGNAIALYFIVQYRIVIDATMIGNVFHTNVKEASELAHPKLLLYLLLGILAAWALLRVRLVPSPRVRRAGAVLAALALGSVFLYANAQSWLWIDKNAKQFGGLVLPWSYVINTVRYMKDEAELHRAVEPLPALSVKRPGGIVFVLVIGESARAQNFSLYGYGRPTNSLLQGDGVVALAGAHSCATYTTASLRCMLSSKGAGGMGGGDEPLPSYLHRYGIEVVWRSNNFGEPPLKVSRYETADQIRKACSGDCARLHYDDVLLYGLDALLRQGQADTKTLVVLHQGGSHGPQYASKYPPAFERFKPTCHSVELQKCSNAELVNAYDNTVVYTDHVLHEVIGLLRTVHDRPTVMLYMSDHGESLGENGLYLHGVPKSFAPEVQSAVPLVVWMSDEFKRLGASVRPASGFAGGLTHDVVFHSVLGAMGLDSPVYQPANDLFRFTTSAAPGGASGGRHE
jgi:lipid A ethanolaminephosphotransferase